MKLRELYEHGGRIVKGVNTTPDVGVNQIPIEAGKFGFKVDKDGRPPELNKKARKNSSPNTLFNLGLAESKVNEIRAEELSSSSEIFVDMDGVLVDFFGAWTKLMKVKKWFQIKNVEKGLQKIRDTEDFWINLKPTKNADRLLSIIKDIKGEYNILSAPMADDPRVEPSKRAWVEKHLKAFPPKKVIITANKQAYAKQKDGTPNILIDDFGQNVRKWEGAGGVGFKHKDHKFERTASSLKKHFEKPATEGDLIPLPKNSVSVDSDATDYDFMKLGRNMANIATTEPDDANMGDQDIMLNFFGGEKEKQHMISNLKRLGYKVGDVSGYQDHNFDPEPTKGEPPPQIHAKDVDGKLGKMKVALMVPVQKDRSFRKLAKQYKDVKLDEYNPIVVDRKGRICNGHHRYDALRLLDNEYALVKMVDTYLEDIMSENFADGKKPGRKGLSKRVGIPKKATISQLSKIAKSSSGEKRRMAQWQLNMRRGKAKKGK